MGMCVYLYYNLCIICKSVLKYLGVTQVDCLVIFESERALCMTHIYVSLHWLLFCAVIGWNSSSFKNVCLNTLILSTCVPCCLAAAGQCSMVWHGWWLWSCTQSHSTNILTLCCCASCSHGMSSMSFPTFSSKFILRKWFENEITKSSWKNK